jgi:hypothetical protein
VSQRTLVRVGTQARAGIVQRGRPPAPVLALGATGPTSQALTWVSGPPPAPAVRLGALTSTSQRLLWGPDDPPPPNEPPPPLPPTGTRLVAAYDWNGADGTPLQGFQLEGYGEPLPRFDYLGGRLRLQLTRPSADAPAQVRTAYQPYAAAETGVLDYLGTVRFPTDPNALWFDVIWANRPDLQQDSTAEYVALRFSPFGTRGVTRTGGTVNSTANVLPHPQGGVTLNVRARLDLPAERLYGRWWTGATEPTGWQYTSPPDGNIGPFLRETAFNRVLGGGYRFSSGSVPGAHEILVGPATITATGAA